MHGIKGSRVVPWRGLFCGADAGGLRRCLAFIVWFLGSYGQAESLPQKPAAPKAQWETLAEGEVVPMAIPKHPVISLSSVQAESTDKLSVVTARLSEAPPYKVLYLEDHGAFLQVRLPNTLVVDSGSFYDGHGPYIEKIAAYQVTPQEGMLRLFLSQDAALVKPYSSVEVLGSRVVVSMDHHALQRALNQEAKLAPSASIPLAVAHDGAATAKEPASTELVPKAVPVPTASDVQQTAGIPAVMEAVQKPKQGEEAPQAASGLGSMLTAEPSLEKALMGSALFSLFMLLVAMTVLGLQKMRRIRVGEGTGLPDIAMRTVNQMMLSPKQKLAVVQVGQEQWLLAISPDQVSLLTQVSSRISTGGGHKATSIPQTPVLKVGVAPMGSSSTGSSQTGNSSTGKSDGKKSAPVGSKPVPHHLTQQADQRIQYTIDEGGVRNMRTGGATPPLGNRKIAPGDGHKTIEDVTQMIREKLKTLPKL